MAARRSKAKAKAQEPGFLEALKELAREKGVEEEVLFDAIEAALADPGDPASRIERAACFSFDEGFAEWERLVDTLAGTTGA